MACCLSCKYLRSPYFYLSFKYVLSVRLKQEQKTINLQQMQRLKKKKLLLKDKIANLKDKLEPDIIA